LGTDGKTYVRDVFQGNVIPSTRFDPVAKKILDGLWAANTTPTTRPG